MVCVKEELRRANVTNFCLEKFVFTKGHLVKWQKTLEGVDSSVYDKH